MEQSYIIGAVVVLIIIIIMTLYFSGIFKNTNSKKISSTSSSSTSSTSSSASSSASAPPSYSIVDENNGLKKLSFSLALEKSQPTNIVAAVSMDITFNSKNISKSWNVVITYSDGRTASLQSNMNSPSPNIILNGNFNGSASINNFGTIFNMSNEIDLTTPYENSTKTVMIKYTSSVPIQVIIMKETPVSHVSKTPIYMFNFALTSQSTSQSSNYAVLMSIEINIKSKSHVGMVSFMYDNYHMAMCGTQFTKLTSSSIIPIIFALSTSPSLQKLTDSQKKNFGQIDLGKNTVQALTPNNGSQISIDYSTNHNILDLLNSVSAVKTYLSQVPTQSTQTTQSTSKPSNQSNTSYPPQIPSGSVSQSFTLTPETNNLPSNIAYAKNMQVILTPSKTIIIIVLYSNNDHGYVYFSNWSTTNNIITTHGSINGPGLIPGFCTINFSSNTIVLMTPVINSNTMMYITYHVSSPLNSLFSHSTPSIAPISVVFTLKPSLSGLKNIIFANAMTITIDPNKLYNPWKLVFSYNNNKTITTISQKLGYPILFIHGTNITGVNTYNYLNLPVNSDFCALDIRNNTVAVYSPSVSTSVMMKNAVSLVKYNLNKPVIQTILAALPKNSPNPF